MPAHIPTPLNQPFQARNPVRLVGLADSRVSIHERSPLPVCQFAVPGKRVSEDLKPYGMAGLGFVARLSR
jgi:hypothetical protein